PITDWPQVQRDPQHTGYYPAPLGTSFRVTWTHPFQPERVHPQVQAIVYAGRVFVGTEMGNLYALNAATGAQAWVFPVGAPILNSVAADDGRVFFGAMDGAVYALNVGDGSLAWKAQLSQRLGFSTAPVLADGKVLLGGRDGVFYALSPTSGTVQWQYDVGSPILQTAAWDYGRVFFGAMDMRVYALYSSTGSLAWRSGKIHGMAFKDYWSVVTQGLVLVRPVAKEQAWLNTGFPRVGFPFMPLWSTSDPAWNWIMQYGPTVAAGRLTELPDAVSAQDTAMVNYAANPAGYVRNLFILDEVSGQETFVVPHWANQTMNGTTTPSCVDREGKLVVPTYFVRSGWARLDLARRRIVDILYDHRNADGTPLTVGSYPAGTGNLDETLNVTCALNMIIAMHTEEGNANYTGFFNLDIRRWSPIAGGHTSSQMSSNNQGGGGNPASIAGGMVYHVSYHELIARSTY
ncbi:MAG: PQQ-binding-like beta-propeller repeat protein, partial [Actinobacteria bacterium]|nr:PQQ-binding-like beta-propeller repeat protein [Actinomycetota bacterium]